MKHLMLIILIAFGFSLTAHAGPTEDLAKYQRYFKQKFPDVPYTDYINGIYSLHKGKRNEWEAIMEFPPYELALDQGEKLFNTSFKSGKTYASCFKNAGKNIAHNYPYWDKSSGKVKTIEAEINECRVRNGEKALKYKKGPIVSISAYIHSLARGNKTNVVVPANDPGALKAYNRGKQFYFARRGQLNFSCAHCHFDGAGKYIRANLLSMAIGQTTHFPTYRSKWGVMGTIQRRYTGCNKQVRAKPFKAQGPEYTNLQYFHTYMSNGLELNAPGTRF